MAWTILPFGKHQGKTLPQIVLSDPDWFFYMLPRFYGRLADQAQEIARKARAIKVPALNGKPRAVEYWYEEGPRFVGFGFVDANCPRYNNWGYIMPYLDLSWVRREKAYDKRGSNCLIRDFRRNYFGPNTRLTKERCEAFFDDEANFVNRASYLKASLTNWICRAAAGSHQALGHVGSAEAVWDRASEA